MMLAAGREREFATFLPFFFFSPLAAEDATAAAADDAIIEAAACGNPARPIHAGSNRCLRHPPAGLLEVATTERSAVGSHFCVVANTKTFPF